MEKGQEHGLRDLIGSSFAEIADLGDDRDGTEAILSWLGGEEVKLPGAGRTATRLSVKSPEELLFGRR